MPGQDVGGTPELVAPLVPFTPLNALPLSRFMAPWYVSGPISDTFSGSVMEITYLLTG